MANHMRTCGWRYTARHGGTALPYLLLGALSLCAAGAQAQVVTTCPAALETTQLFSYTGAPATFSVPANVTQLRVIAVGADGGEIAGGFAGGSGARAEGTFAVTTGQTFTIIAGQSPGGTNDFEAGGGGASGAYLGAALALIAGGGGGDDNTGNGGGGTASTAGGNGGNPVGSNCNAGGLGGIGGQGGQYGELPDASQTNACQTGNGGGGGGGFNSAGGSSAVQNLPPARRGPSGGARCSIGGAAGGQGGLADPTNADNIGAAGGFGICGGGGADHREAGGGGGYSGGGGGPEGQLPGGGGSFVAATAISPTLNAGVSGGGRGRNGSVRLCYSTRAELTITKTNTPASGAADLTGDTVDRGAITTYDIVVRNGGPVAADNATLRDPAPSGLTACTLGAPACAASGGAACPATGSAAGELSVANLQGAGVRIPLLPMGGGVTFKLACTVQ
jgi:uncharacterized repeat protein (TIGR01451 family)